MSDAFIKTVSVSELSNFHRSLLQGLQPRMPEAPPTPPKPQPKPKKPKTTKPPRPKATKTAKPKPDPVIEESLVSEKTKPGRKEVVYAIVAFLKDGKEATLVQLVAASGASHADAHAVIDWMRQERLIVRCGSYPTRYRRY
jgi:outer membrane biosynthesis protein TonB